MNVCGWGLTVEIGVGKEKSRGEGYNPGESEGEEERQDRWGIKGRELCGRGLEKDFFYV